MSDGETGTDVRIKKKDKGAAVKSQSLEKTKSHQRPRSSPSSVRKGRNGWATPQPRGC